MSRTLRGRHVVVTGGGTGLGAAVAGAFAAEGASLTLMSRSQTALEAQASALRRLTDVHVEATVCDVTDSASVIRAFDTAVQTLGAVHILINNAGHATASEFLYTTLDAWQQVMDVNLTGTFLCTQRVLPEMLTAGNGRIVNIASTAGLKGYSRVAAYCAAKHGVIGLTRALAAEIKRTGVTVNAICPDYIEGSAMLESAIASVAAATGKTEQDARAYLEAHTIRGRFDTVREVADAVLALCTADAVNTTGQAIVLGGGEALP